MKTFRALAGKRICQINYPENISTLVLHILGRENVLVYFTLRTKKNDVLNVANFFKHSLQLNICSYDQNDLPVKKK